MKVHIHLLSQSRPIFRVAENAYVKADLYCVLLQDGIVEKYPLCNIFRISEES